MPKMQEHFSAVPSPDSGSGGVIVALRATELFHRSRESECRVKN